MRHTQQRGWVAASLLLLFLAGSVYAQLDRGQIAGFPTHQARIVEAAVASFE